MIAPQTELALSFDLHLFGTHLEFSMAALSLPAVIPLAAYGSMLLGYRLKIISRQSASAKPRPFIELAYGYLPLVLAGNLAHYLRLGLTEGGRLLPVDASDNGPER